MEKEQEARLYVDDGGALQGDPLFVGPFTEAVKLVWKLGAKAQSFARIETANEVFTATRLDEMRRLDEGFYPTDAYGNRIREPDVDTTLQQGAVAIIDALGFKGIWSRHEPRRIVEALEQVAMAAKALITRHPAYGAEYRIAFLSDSIAVSYRPDPHSRHPTMFSTRVMLDLVGSIMAEALRSKVPLAYRGAISVGSFYVSDRFLLGPAIDQAAAVHQVAEGAIVWTTPHAKADAESWHEMIPTSHGVPLKNVGLYHTMSASILSGAKDEADGAWLASRLLSTFVGGDVSIAIKRQNTLEHLRYCFQDRGWSVPADLV